MGSRDRRLLARLTVGGVTQSIESEPPLISTTVMSRVNAALRAATATHHQDPATGPRSVANLGPRRSLGHLHAVVAHLWLYNRMPRDDKPSRARWLIARYRRSAAITFAPGIASLLALPAQSPQGPRFDHAGLATVIGGCFVPTDFARVVPPQRRFGTFGQRCGPIGSSYRLRTECRALADHLQVPLSLDPEDANLQAVLHRQQHPNEHWQVYVVASFVCLHLYRAAQRSIDTGQMLLVH